MMDGLKKSGCRPYDWSCAPPADDMIDLPCGPWDPKSNALAATTRYGMAFLGSVMLIGPMLLMVLVESLVARLVTAGVCTLVFAAGVAQLSKRSPFELLTAVAAYTAVLVVFVGTSTLNHQ